MPYVNRAPCLHHLKAAQRMQLLCIPRRRSDYLHYARLLHQPGRLYLHECDCYQPTTTCLYDYCNLPLQGEKRMEARRVQCSAGPNDTSPAGRRPVRFAARSTRRCPPRLAACQPAAARGRARGCSCRHEPGALSPGDLSWITMDRLNSGVDGVCPARPWDLGSQEGTR